MKTRPRVITHNVSSLDGRVGLPGVLLLHGDERWEEIAQGAVSDMWSLHQPQVMLEGSNSFVTRDAPPVELPPAPAGVQLHADYLPAGSVSPERRFFAVIDSRGRVRWEYTVGPGDEHLLVFVSRATPSAYLAFLRERESPYIVAGGDRVDLSEAIGKLATCLNVSTLVSSGGGLLNGALLQAGLVDEVDIDFMPALISGGGAPILFDGPPLRPGDRPVRLAPIAVEAKPDGGVFARYDVVHPT